MSNQADSSTFTYQTRLNLSAAQDSGLSAYAKLYCTTERKLFSKLATGASAAKLKSEFISKYGITARQYNAISLNLAGKVSSITELRKTHLNETELRILKAQKVIKTLEKKESTPKLSRALHFKKRRLAASNLKLTALKNDLKECKVRLCFGSRKLFRAQFDLKANQYKDIKEWRKEWQAARSNQFYVIGSKDETAGCQGCVATLNAEGNLTLKLRLPDALAAQHGKLITLDNVHFAYGHDNIVAALKSSERVEVKIKDKKAQPGEPQEKTIKRLTGTALSYRFIRVKKGWSVHVSVSVEAPKHISHRQLGAIGVDINADHLACAEIDRFGNVIKTKRIECFTYGLSSDQATAVIGDAIKIAADWAAKINKVIVIEKLDFSKKKAQLESEAAKDARALSSFSYSKINTMTHSACFRQGVEVIEVNPAYTSVIGAVNYAQKLGISTHLGAATAIARRGLGFSEISTVKRALVPVKNGDHVTFSLPVRNRKKHVWSYWVAVRRTLKAAHVAHFRSGKSKDNPAPLSQMQRTSGVYWNMSAESRHANRHWNCPGDVLDDIPQ
jgi:IS605 OrfB family transposase